MQVLIKFHSHTNIWYIIHVSLQSWLMRFQINTVNFTNLRFHVQNVSFDITSITLVWTGEAAEEPCKELMALSPLPPLESQGSRVSPGEPPRPPLTGPLLALLPAYTPCHADTSRNMFWDELPLNPLRIDLDPSMSRHANFLSDSQVAQLDFTGEHAFRLPGRYFPSVRAFSRWHASWTF